MEKESCSHFRSNKFSKSIFSYITDRSMYVHKDECNNYQPPFLAYNPTGVPQRNIEIENNLRGNRPLSKCTECKYIPEKLINGSNVYSDKYDIYDEYPNNKRECDESKQ